MFEIYRCGSDRRRRLVLDQTELNGIDFLEVDADDPSQIVLHFLRDAPAFTPDDVAIDGGVRHRSIAVVQIRTVPGSPRVLGLTTDQVGDHSAYRLRLVQPTGFDPALSEVEFTFLAHCDVGLDCPTPEPCPPVVAPPPVIDYLARDFRSFRRILLERLSALRADWTPRTAVDPMVALVEILAFEADRLSYGLDAAATESYLGTAKQRRSLRRHAKLLDYAIHEGGVARTWVHVAAARPATWDRFVDPPVRLVAGDGTDEQIFTVVSDAFALHPDQNEIRLHTWGERDGCLPCGATRAWLDVQGLTPQLAAGDYLLFEQVRSPETGTRADRDPLLRHVVRLVSVERGTDPVTQTDVLHVHWAEDDALPFAMVLEAELDDASVVPVVIARGNVVPVQHGAPRSLVDLVPTRRWGDRYDLPLPVGSLAFPDPVDAQASAMAWTVVDPHRGRPAIALVDEAERRWHAQPDLLQSEPHDLHFVVEVDQHRQPWIRFGDGVHGALPVSGQGPLTFRAEVRVGGGTAGNVGAEGITQVFELPAHDDGEATVRNPLPARGGSPFESAEDLRRDVPEAYRFQERAVVPADYARAAQRASPEVLGAWAGLRWTGSHYAIDVAVDLRGGRRLTEDVELADLLRSALEDRRMLGVSVRLRDAQPVPLDLGLVVHLEGFALRTWVSSALRRTFSAGLLPEGSPGFFHPDRFSFGDALYLSDLVAHASQVPGVCAVEVDPAGPGGDHLRFHRWGRPPNGELDRGVIRPAPHEILVVQSDPNRPEHGRILFHLLGGR